MPVCSLWVTFVAWCHANSGLIKMTNWQEDCRILWPLWGVRWTDHDQIRSRINNNWYKTFWPHRPLSTACKMFCTQLAMAHVAETSCISRYWFCYISAHDQFVRYWERSNECLWHICELCELCQLIFDKFHSTGKVFWCKLLHATNTFRVSWFGATITCIAMLHICLTSNYI